VLLLVSLPGYYACTQHQQRRDAFFWKTNSGEKGVLLFLEHQQGQKY
jgi:hypothetical protein